MNENIFSGKAEVYMQCRPRYAQGVLDFIRRETALTPDSLIADIGAGTGIFTEQLMSLGCRVAAVEPNGDMRSRIAETAPGAEIISAPAEHTGLPDGSVLHELNMKYCEKYRSLFTNNEQFSVSDEKYKVMSENYLTNSRREIYPNDLMFTKEQFIGNRISRSYAPKSGDPEFDNYRTALEEFFEQHQQNGVILIPNNTVCFIGMA